MLLFSCSYYWNLWAERKIFEYSQNLPQIKIFFFFNFLLFLIDLHSHPPMQHTQPTSFTLFASCMMMMRCILFHFFFFLEILLCYCFLVHGEKQYKHVDASCGSSSMLFSCLSVSLTKWKLWASWSYTPHKNHDINLSFLLLLLLWFFFIFFFDPMQGTRLSNDFSCKFSKKNTIKMQWFVMFFFFYSF